ncbi:MAG: hypothetical protein IPH20_15660 [Bacteroidales bacterium]|nr:hypothetical protein [Bacteroidales bacterium]
MRNKYYIIAILLSAVLFSGFSGKVNAQELKDNKKPTDVIIRVDGIILYGKVTELNSDNIRYYRAEMPEGPLVAIPRKEVYAISYSNQTYEVITPLSGKSKGKSQKSETPAPAGEPEKKQAKAPDTLSSDWKKNIGNGYVKVGMGFSRQYSSLKGVENFSKTPSAPSLYADYNFQFNKYIKLGAALGVAGFKYEYDEFSEYDQIGITQNITEQVATLGVYARYDITGGILKTYVRGGVDFNLNIVNIDGEIFFKDENKKITSHSEGRGFNSDFIIRGGAEIFIGKNFGLYSDIGTGKSLVQVGVVFSLVKK